MRRLLAYSPAIAIFIAGIITLIVIPVETPAICNCPAGHGANQTVCSCPSSGVVFHPWGPLVLMISAAAAIVTYVIRRVPAT